MDITPLFSQSLESHSSRPLKAHPFDIDSINSFLQEAYRINRHIADLTKYLRSIRAPYLALGTHRSAPSNRATNRPNGSAQGPLHADKDGHMTDDERKAIEVETKDVINSLKRKITEIDRTVKVSSELAAQIAEKTRSKRGFGALGRWAAGGATVEKAPEELEQEAKDETVRVYREGVIFFLQMRLERVSELQRDMVAVRLQRTVERNKSSLYRSGVDAEMFGMGATPVNRSRFQGNTTNASAGSDLIQLDEENEKKGQDPGIASLLSPEQIQMFETEQEDMVRFYNSELLKIRYLHLISLLSLSNS
jgi:syntaxin 18